MFNGSLKYIVIFLLFVFNPIISLAKTNTFAVVIDSITYVKTQPALIEYLEAVRKDNLHTALISGNWKSPDEVREKIINLSESVDKLGGIVLIGDIPIPMIRDAQHLTSAFKIDQTNKRFSWKRTSVPSDRFYDDFDLKFTFLKRDTANSLLFYYALNADSPQKIRSEIYSARIMAPVNDSSKYEMISSFLKKAAQMKLQKNKLEQAFVFTGHGYHTESLDAWSSNLLSYKEQFPQLFEPGGSLKMYNHEMNPFLKFQLIRDLQNTLLDLAIFHAHGADDTQYLVGFEPSQSLGQNVDAIKMFLRSKMRRAKRRKQDIQKTQAGYQERYGFPDEWFADNDSLKKADSLLYDSQDMHISDMQEMKPQAKLIYFDECFNGAFIERPYVAGTYLFDSSGQSVAAIANSVNVLQDIWPDQFLGLLNYGLRIGEWSRLHNSLEKHIFGDPTFHFFSENEMDLSKTFHKLTGKTRTLKKCLKNDVPALRNLSVSLLAANEGSKFEKQLLTIFKNDVSSNVRLQALKGLAVLNSEGFEEALILAAQDPAELIRRFAAIMMGDTGKEKFLETLAELRIYGISDRVRFNADQALKFINPIKARDICLNKIDEMKPSIYHDAQTERINRSFSYENKSIETEIIPHLADTSIELKKRISTARRLRNYRYQQVVPQMIKTALNEEDDESLRITLIEALGWYSLNFQKPQIVAACDNLLAAETVSENIKKAAISTKNRLQEGFNDPLIR